jgi:hypothetical protein
MVAKNQQIPWPVLDAVATTGVHWSQSSRIVIIFPQTTGKTSFRRLSSNHNAFGRLDDNSYRIFWSLPGGIAVAPQTSAGMVEAVIRLGGLSVRRSVVRGYWSV